MNILLLAPQPFFQERGTPIAVDLALRTLGEQGHRVDVLAYHEGEDVHHPNVRLHRIPRLPLVRNVPPGFSFRTLCCDAVMTVHALALARRLRPDLVHAVEEAVFMAVLIRAAFGIPFLYDMDSRLSRQLAEGHRWLRPFGPAFRAVERAAVRRARMVVPVCEALADQARDLGAAETRVLSDVSLLDVLPAAGAPEPDIEQFRAGGICYMYVGNLEAYQGVDLLLESFRLVRDREPGARLVVVGGAPRQIARCRRRAGELGLAGAVLFAGPRPLRRLAGVLAQADVLVSPRLRGENTPMKIYTYLDSGRPVVATRLPTHCQVLSDEVAVLAPPEPEPFAQALLSLAGDPERRRQLAAAARRLVAERHSLGRFRQTLGEIYAGLQPAAGSG